MGSEEPVEGRSEVLTDQARIEHAERGREALDRVQGALDDGGLLTDYTWRKVEILAQVAQAHFTAASLPNVSRYMARSNTPDPGPTWVARSTPQDDDQQ